MGYVSTTEAADETTEQEQPSDDAQAPTPVQRVPIWGLIPSEATHARVKRGIVGGWETCQTIDEATGQAVQDFPVRELSALWLVSNWGPGRFKFNWEKFADGAIRAIGWSREFDARLPAPGRVSPGASGHQRTSGEAHTQNAKPSDFGSLLGALAPLAEVALAWLDAQKAQAEASAKERIALMDQFYSRLEAQRSSSGPDVGRTLQAVANGLNEVTERLDKVEELADTVKADRARIAENASNWAGFATKVVDKAPDVISGIAGAVAEGAAKGAAK